MKTVDFELFRVADIQNKFPWYYYFTMNSYTYKNVQKAFRDQADPARAKMCERYFKTGKGEYAEGDKFLGLTNPMMRNTARKFYGLPLPEIEKLITSPYHEERVATLVIALHQFKKGDEKVKKSIFDFYLANTKYINNWDLVDISAGTIVGQYLKDKPKTILTKLAHSEYLFERRIAMIATFEYIYHEDATEALRIATILLHDKHDLIHKAVGWMLREIGKKCSEKILCDYLDIHTPTMPRTTLRYAIERFPEEKRQKYLRITRS